MERVQGVGGVFLRATDREKQLAFYRDGLGVAIEDWGGGVFPWAAQDRADAAMTVFSVFPADSAYLPAAQQAMVNFRVRDLDAMRAQLVAYGADVDPKVEESEFGRFGWVTDPGGLRIELWQPPP